MAKKQTEPVTEDLETKGAAWPKSTETRSLACKLDPGELAERSDEMARHQLELNRIEASKKSANSHFKAQIDEKSSQINRLAQLISDRAEYRDTKCEWRYEQSGVEADGNPIFHPEKKTLIRLDTGEPVEIRHIDDHERQLKLDLEGGEGETEEAA